MKRHLQSANFTCKHSCGLCVFRNHIQNQPDLAVIDAQRFIQLKDTVWRIQQGFGGNDDFFRSICDGYAFARGKPGQGQGLPGDRAIHNCICDKISSRIKLDLNWKSIRQKGKYVLRCSIGSYGDLVLAITFEWSPLTDQHGGRKSGDRSEIFRNRLRVAAVDDCRLGFICNPILQSDLQFQVETFQLTCQIIGQRFMGTVETGLIMQLFQFICGLTVQPLQVPCGLTGLPDFPVQGVQRPDQAGTWQKFCKSASRHISLPMEEFYVGAECRRFIWS